MLVSFCQKVSYLFTISTNIVIFYYHQYCCFYYYSPYYVHLNIWSFFFCDSIQMPCLSKYLRILSAVPCKSLNYLSIFCSLLFLIIPSMDSATPNLTMLLHSAHLFWPCFCNINTKYYSSYEFYSRDVIDYAFHTPNQIPFMCFVHLIWFCSWTQCTNFTFSLRFHYTWFPCWRAFYMWFDYIHTYYTLNMFIHLVIPFRKFKLSG